ncbi:response regulator transcription factor [Streptomyces sp. bgisy027]|uniref:response regulator transcription factor n=1 Tax=Streptomyces sp. bgisy027 TaxID=3413770 RepID=UPI003D70F8B2
MRTYADGCSTRPSGWPGRPPRTRRLARGCPPCNNAEVGRRLSLLPETVKSYLRSAMRKLGAGTRFEAVVAARRQGLLP